MRILLVVVAAALALGCATPQQESETQLKAAADAIDQAAQELENQMSPDERQALHQHAEQRAMAEMQVRAVQCGTELRFTDEPNFEDRHVFVVASATPEQLACVQKSYPFVKAQPK